jgi:hypothetical protein
MPATFTRGPVGTRPHETLRRLGFNFSPVIGKAGRAEALVERLRGRYAGADQYIETQIKFAVHTVSVASRPHGIRREAMIRLRDDDEGERISDRDCGPG